MLKHDLFVLGESNVLASTTGIQPFKRLRVRSETEEPVLLGETVQPVILGHLVAGIVLAAPGLHGIEFREGLFSNRRVAGTVLLGQRFDEIRAFKNDMRP